VTRVNTQAPDLQTVEKALLLAHEQNNYSDLVTYYSKAATLMENQGDIDAACFYLTQAYVYAMECGSDQAQELHNRLAKHGRVAPNK